MERVVKGSVRPCLFLCFLLVGLGAGFNPTQPILGRSSSVTKYQNPRSRESITSPKQEILKKKSCVLPRLDRSLCTHAKSEDYDDDDDDDEEISVEDDDWRAFRAKLVMGEKTANEGENAPSTTRTTSTDDKSGSALSDGKTDGQVDKNVVKDDGDLDGIGSIFRDDFTDTVESESETEAGKTELTPLDPSQWAYDSGDVIEQGAVILGGIEQEVSADLDQGHFHAKNKRYVISMNFNSVSVWIWTQATILSQNSDSRVGSFTNFYERNNFKSANRFDT